MATRAHGRKQSKTSWLWEAVEDYKASGAPLPTTEDILIATWCAVAETPQDPRYLNTLKQLLATALDCRKQIWIESGGGKDALDALYRLADHMAPPDKPRPK